MPTVNGYETICGIKVEAVPGTPVAVGAGNGLEIRDGAEIKPRYTRKTNEDALVSIVTKSWLNPEQPGGTFPMYLNYWGLELPLAILMGSTVAPAAHPDGNIDAYILEIKRAKLSETATLAVALGDGQTASDILRVAELAGTMFSELKITQGAGTEPEAEFTAVSESCNYDSTTNTTATMPNVTAADASYPARPATFEDLDIWLAHQDADSFSASDAIDASGFDLTIMSGVEDDVTKHRSTSGGLVPVQTARKNTEMVLRFLRDNSDTQVFRDLIDQNEKLKMLIKYTSDQGIPGMSVSDATPSTDISASLNSKFKATFTLANGDSESKEIALTVGTLSSGALIAAAIQAAFRAATATDTVFQRILDNVTCDYNTSVTGKYTLGVDTDDLVNVTVVAASASDLAPELKMGAGNGGDEYDYVEYQIRFYCPEVTFEPLGETLSGGVNEVEYSGSLMASYGTSAPVGFTTADALLASNLSKEDVRIVIVGRVSTDPLA